ncbi:MAG TPA: hypothetical protein VFY13_05585 [Luteolibacter sp.]|nr:hypothetical protein [Luteolibacter sp.]
MHFRLTEQELATLVEMASLAADVAAWNHRESAQGMIAAFEQLENKLLAKAAQSGLSHLIEFDQESQRLRLKSDPEHPLFHQECYDEFRNESFWDELAIRLADRDLARAIGQQAWEALSEDERRTRAKELEKHYWDEFTRHGITRVVVLHPPEEG